MQRTKRNNKNASLALFVLCISLVINLFSSPTTASNFHLSEDSISDYHYYLKENWKFKEGDDASWALPAYDDTKWVSTKTSLNQSDTSSPEFNGIGWFRLRFTVDSALTGKPLAMAITHYGASETYLDGKLINSFGIIKGKDSSIYVDPQEVPYVFTINGFGEHLLAVRYANYNAKKNSITFRQSFAGFKMMIGGSAVQIENKYQRIFIATFCLMVLTGIFSALFLLHLFMYLYNRAQKRNLYFSLFMLCLALVFILLFISYASPTPSQEVLALYLLVPVIVIASIALSGFINSLFAKKKSRFKIMLGLGILALIFRFTGLDVYLNLTVFLIISVAFEAVFTVIFAMIKRVKGARIIGTGILFSSLFILTVFANAIIGGGRFDLNDSTLGGQLVILFFALAILSIPLSMSIYLAWNFASINKDLELQLKQVNLLSEKSLEYEHEKQRMLENKKEELEQEVLKRTSELTIEKKKSDDLLLNILPADVAEELKTKGRTDAKTYSMVTVMFTDFKDFTDVSEKISAELLVAEIDYCFSAFDTIIQKYRIEKIKTIGDAYICAAGLPKLNFTHAEDMINAALEIRDFMLERKREKEAKGEIPFELRIGINTGPLVAGIVGIKKFAYDIWGDTVNLAQRMESSGEAGKVNISGSTYELVKNKFVCHHRGKIVAKNKGEIDMFFVEQKV